MKLHFIPMLPHDLLPRGGGTALLFSHSPSHSVGPSITAFVFSISRSISVLLFFQSVNQSVFFCSFNQSINQCSFVLQLGIEELTTRLLKTLTTRLLKILIIFICVLYKTMPLPYQRMTTIKVSVVNCFSTVCTSFSDFSQRKKQ